MERLKAWSWHSLTIFVGYVQFAIGAVIALLPLLAEVLASPEVKSQILAWSPDKWDGVVLMAIAIITILARFRSL